MLNSAGGRRLLSLPLESNACHRLSSKHPVLPSIAGRWLESAEAAGHMGVAKVGDSQTLSRSYCHVEENFCEVAREDRAFACGETGDETSGELSR
jgi:hypothetical protein